MYVAHNPMGDGSCQFEAVAYHFRNRGVNISHVQLRAEVVKYMTDHPYCSDNVTHLSSFIQVHDDKQIDWNTYLATMTKQSTYGDHLTLQALAKIYQCQVRYLLFETIVDYVELS